MPLQFLKKLSVKILHRSTTDSKPTSSQNAKRGKQQTPPQKKANSATLPQGKPSKQQGSPRTKGDKLPRAKRNDRAHVVRTDDKQRSLADGEKQTAKPKRLARREQGNAPKSRPPQGHSNPNAMRPGGAVSADEMSRRRIAHESWSIDQFVVVAAEGKKRFHDFDLPAEIMHAIADLKFEYCTPIQAQSLEHALAGKNVAGKAQTGTGKTAAFLVALLTRYLRTPEARPNVPGQPRALIIAPTRELVIQICQDADSLGKYCGLRYLAVYGGMDYDRQRQEIEAEPVDLLVATPGRLLDFVKGKVIDLAHVDTLVIDEADRMLDMGFIPDVKRIMYRLPPPEKRSTMLYSATLNETVMTLAARWMTEPISINIESESLAVSTIKQIVYIVTAKEKFTVLFNLLRTNPTRRILVFCNRRSSTEMVCNRLARLGIPCEMLSGDVQQSRRLRVLEDFRAGKIRVVVATDVAGRGIHVEDIGFVVNFDFPYEADDYVHRIGRTGRAGQIGTAISFADENESFIIPEIEEYIGESLKCSMPDESLLQPIGETATPDNPPHSPGQSMAKRPPRKPLPPRRSVTAHAPKTPPSATRPTPSSPPTRAPQPVLAPPAIPGGKRPVAEEWVPGKPG